MPPDSTSRRFPGRLDAILVFLLLLGCYGYFFHDSGWNGNSRLCQIFAIVHEGRLEIDSFHEWPPTQTGDKAFYEGHYYSDKSIGTALLGTLAYFPLHRFLQLASLDLTVEEIRYYVTLVVIGLPSALAGALFFVLCAQISGSRARAYIATLAYSLGTMSFAFSALLFGHQPAASFLFIAFFLIARLKRGAAPRRPALLAAVGLSLGLAMVSEYTTLLIAIPLSIYYLRIVARAPRAQRLAAVWIPLAAGLVPVGLQLLNNAICFDHPLRNAYLYHDVPSFQQGIRSGLMGIGWPRAKVLFYLSLHPARGLFWQSPVLLSACVGFFFMFRDRAWREEAIVASTAVAAMLLLNAGYFYWWGGWTFGPRFLIPMLPFFCLPVIFLPRRHFLHVVPLTAISVLVMLIITAQHPMMPGDLSDIDQQPLFSHHPLLQSLYFLARGEYCANVGRQLGLVGAWSLLPMAIGLGVVSWLLLRPRADGLAVDRRGPPSRSGRTE